MRMTTAQLKRIIKEELAKAIREADEGGESLEKQVLAGLVELDKMIDSLSVKAGELDREREGSNKEPYQYAGKDTTAQELIKLIFNAIDHAMTEISDQGGDPFPTYVGGLIGKRG